MSIKRTENGIDVSSDRILRDAQAERRRYLAHLLSSLFRLRSGSRFGIAPAAVHSY